MELSELHINELGQLCRVVEFGENDIVDFIYNGVSLEQEVFGIFFSYSE